MDEGNNLQLDSEIKNPFNDLKHEYRSVSFSGITIGSHFTLCRQTVPVEDCIDFGSSDLNAEGSFNNTGVVADERALDNTGNVDAAEGLVNESAFCNTG
jgi:hypothetical protein